MFAECSSFVAKQVVRSSTSMRVNVRKRLVLCCHLLKKADEDTMLEHICSISSMESMLVQEPCMGWR